ncbi:MAG: alkaline phosphatase D family protein, partial [Gammaproteobacteria bacterium]|nr:alkaline phosphatase D family protein [Gammaproteobacteria bacterium]
VNLPACAGLGSQRHLENNASFTHGVASGDPLADRLILWTRALPEYQAAAVVTLQVSQDPDFTRNVIEKGQLECKPESDYTLKVDLGGLDPDTVYYYRFLSKNAVTRVGKARTLPVGEKQKVKLLAASCSFYSAGYFHVYAEMAKHTDAHAVLHLGDYIYEYGPGVYADKNAKSMNRVMQPAHELITLADYRQRYAQTRSDTDLQALHASLAMIAVWDDHEVTNDTWSDGAENHSDDEGDFSQRRLAALQAYSEWMPIRPAVHNDISSIQRRFQFGDLLNLSMLDTRLEAREQQLDYAQFTDPQTKVFDAKSFNQALHKPERTLLGQKQFVNTVSSFNNATTWQVLGQQILMGEMLLPAPVAGQLISLEEYQAIEHKASENPQQLSETEKTILAQAPIPYNLDAWDGYPQERQRLLKAAQKAKANLVVLAGDTHNAWCNELQIDQRTVGIEFATPSVTSPGLEEYVAATPADEARIVKAIPGLSYSNMTDRGYLAVSFTHEQVTADWNYVSSVSSKDYQNLDKRAHSKSFQRQH